MRTEVPVSSWAFFVITLQGEIIAFTSFIKFEVMLEKVRMRTSRIASS